MVTNQDFHISKPKLKEEARSVDKSVHIAFIFNDYSRWTDTGRHLIVEFPLRTVSIIMLSEFRTHRSLEFVCGDLYIGVSLCGSINVEGLGSSKRASNSK